MRIECEFCQEGRFLEDEFGNYALAHIELIPLPAINLTTGERDKTAEPPYHIMQLRYLDFEFDSEMARFPIKYCPVCGRDLRSPKKPLTPEEWVRRERERRKQPGYEEAKKEQQALFARIDKIGKDVKINEDGSIEVKWKPKEKGHD